MKFQTTKKTHQAIAYTLQYKQAAIAIFMFLIFLSLTLTAQETWEEVNDFNDVEIYEIDFVNRYIGFVAGGGSDTDAPSVFKTVDGGQYWMPIEHNIEGRLFAMGFLNDTIGFISTKQGMDSFIYRSTDQGLTWEKVYTMYLRTPGFSFVGDSNVFAMQTSTDFAMTTKSADFGESWEMLDTFSTEWGAAGVTDFLFLTKDLGYMIYESGILYRTNDGGETFEEVYRDFQYDFVAFHFLNADTGYITGKVKYSRDINNAGILLKTTDGGVSWQSTPIQVECTDVIFVNSDTGYLATSSGPLHTCNAGAEWQSSTTLPEGYLKTFSFPAANTGYAIGYKLYSDDLIYKNGVTFGTSINPPQEDKVIVYPNPANYLLHISPQKEMKINKLAVYNLQGKLLIQPEEVSNPLDISSLPPGNYIIAIHTANAAMKEIFVVP